jgi:hypothetical protein
LSINIFTEKIYVLLWFWFVILTVLTLIDLFTFIFKHCVASQRYEYVKKHVQIFNQLKKQHQIHVLNEFTNKYLKPDVVLVLKILATNVNGLVVSELVRHLWENYTRNRPYESTDKLDDQVDNYNSDNDQDYGTNNDHDAIPAFPTHQSTTDLSENDGAGRSAENTPIYRNPRAIASEKPKADLNNVKPGVNNNKPTPV